MSERMSRDPTVESLLAASQGIYNRVLIKSICDSCHPRVLEHPTECELIQPAYQDCPSAENGQNPFLF
jgi:hypothetical protein